MEVNPPQDRATITTKTVARRGTTIIDPVEADKDKVGRIIETQTVKIIIAIQIAYSKEPSYKEKTLTCLWPYKITKNV